MGLLEIDSCPFMGGTRGFADPDLRKLHSVQSYHGIIDE